LFGGKGTEMIATKTCPCCEKRLSASAFNDSAQTADGLARTCRACTNARRRRRDRSHPQHREPAGKPARLAKALRQGDLDAVQKVARGCSKPRWDWVCETMRGGHWPIAKALLKSGAESNVFTMAATGDVAGLSRILRRTPAEARRTAIMQPNCVGVTPLHVGCASDWRSHSQSRMTAQVQLAEILTGHGAEVNAAARYRGLDDATPLFCACWSSGNLALVRWLLDHGALPTDRDLAAALGHFQRHGKGADNIAEALLALGLPVDGSIPGDRTPLQGFAHMGIHRVVAWLIARGADVNARGPGGRTAAHLAAERNTGPKTLALLVDNGADLTARDEDGHTPLDIAELNEKVRLAEWIKRRVGASAR
jgi:ankyrin repeat protein